MRNLLGLLIIIFSVGCHGQSVDIHGNNGSLEFYNGINGIYNSVVYENSKGQKIHMFDTALEFYYAEGVDKYLSPDRSYFFVNFSAAGSSVGDGSPPVDSIEYLCAFVRMSDGCVVRVETGGICGGAWTASHKWVALDGVEAGKLDYQPPSVRKVIENYSSTTNGLSAASTDISEYLLQGTTIDNLLTCNPVSAENKNYYKALVKILERRRDRSNTEKIRKALSTN
jgi:hypothetical protein